MFTIALGVNVSIASEVKVFVGVADASPNSDVNIH